MQICNFIIYGIINVSNNTIVKSSVQLKRKHIIYTFPKLSEYHFTQQFKGIHPYKRNVSVK